MATPVPDAAVRRRDRLAVVLTVGSGSLDAVSFLLLGSVFASVITGNLVLLGVGAARREGDLALHAGVALAAYVVGAGTGARIGGRPVEGGHGEAAWPARATAVLAVELVVLAGFVAWWEAVDAHPAGWAQVVLVGVVAAALGMQGAAVNRLGVTAFSTTYLTSTLVRLVTDVALGRPPVHIRWTAVAGVVGGAAAGAALAETAPAWAPVPALVLLAGVVAAGVVEGRRDGRPVGPAPSS